MLLPNNLNKVETKKVAYHAMFFFLLFLYEYLINGLQLIWSLVRL